MTAYQKVHEEKRGHAAGADDSEKQASQLASDVRYKAKGKLKPGASEEEKKKVFIQILGASPAPNAVKAMAKQKLLGEGTEDSIINDSDKKIIKTERERREKSAFKPAKGSELERRVKSEFPLPNQNNSYEPEGEVIDEMRFNDGKEGTAKRKEALRKKRGLTKDQMDKHPQFKTEGKYRKEWEALKLIETENYREQFDIWLESIAEEGYDIERWSDYELIDTFINENDLWDSRDAIDEALLSEADKKGKGSGKKDACYHKVKASASVWPSAYASGRLVQCRKKGASNYGNSTKKEGFSDWRDDLQVITEKDKPYGAGSEEAKKKGASSYTRGERIYNR